MQQRGYQPSARIIFIELRQAEEPTSKKLELATGAQIIYSHRLRLLNNEPVMLEQFALPAHRLPGFSSHDLCNRSIYEIMNTEYGIKIARAWQSLEPVIASPYEASLLEIQPGAPLMLERRIAYDENGSPVQYSKDLYRGDRFRFITDSAPLEGY
jgi:GntR family transcriptional regulator